MGGTAEVGTHAMTERLNEVEARVGQIRSAAPTPEEPVVVEAADSILLIDGSAFGQEVFAVQEVTHLVSPTSQFTLTIGDEETLPIDPAAAAPEWENDFFTFTQAVQSALAALPITNGDVQVVIVGVEAPGEVDISITPPPGGNHPDIELTGSPTGGSIATTIQGEPGIAEQGLTLVFPENATGFVVGQQTTILLTEVNEETGVTGLYFDAAGDGELLGDLDGQALTRRGANVVSLYLGDNVWTTVSWNDL